SAGSTATLTSGQDVATATTIYGTLGTGATLQGYDVLTGKSTTGNTLSISDGSSNTAALTLPVGVTVSNVQNISVNTSYTAGTLAGAAFDVSGISGVTAVTVVSNDSSKVGDYVKAATTTAITVTDYSDGVETNGGSSVTITSAGTGAADGNVSVGVTTQETGA